MWFSRYMGDVYKLTSNGDGEIRTLDPLLARQVLSQLSSPWYWMWVYPIKAIPVFSFNLVL